MEAEIGVILLDKSARKVKHTRIFDKESLREKIVSECDFIKPEMQQEQLFFKLTISNDRKDVYLVFPHSLKVHKHEIETIEMDGDEEMEN